MNYRISISSLFLVLACCASKKQSGDSLYQELLSEAVKMLPECEFTRNHQSDGSCTARKLVSVSQNGKWNNSATERTSCVGDQNLDAPKELRGQCAKGTESANKIIDVEGNPAIFTWIDQGSK